MLRSITVHGSFITQAHLAMRTITGKLFNVTYDAATMDGNSQAMVSGLCGREAVSPLGADAVRTCDEISASVDFSTLAITTPQWRVKISGVPIYGRISGPTHRIDVGIEPLVAEDELSPKPHGLVGQSFDGSGVPRYGRLDQYPPLLIPGEFTTSAMAEGAIEGVVADYEVAYKYATSYKFGRF